jgi:protein-disulfide isomerase
MSKLPSTRQLADMAVVLCALTVTALLVKREFFSEPEASPGTRQPSVVENWRTYDTGGRILHSADSTAVRVIEFSDFQCPYCASMHAALDSAAVANPGSFQVRYRHFPLTSIHPFALPAAIASECAGRQGAFKGYHDALFATQAQIGVTPWTEFATRAGVRDTLEFKRCLSDPGARDAVTTDIKAATELKLTGTPALLIEDQLVPGAIDAATLEALLRARAR